jgi:Uma2 family endonuclease
MSVDLVLIEPYNFFSLTFVRDLIKTNGMYAQNIIEQGWWWSSNTEMKNMTVFSTDNLPNWRN